MSYLLANYTTPAPVTLLASGTRGDVQPLVALGRGLNEHGLATRVVTHPPFGALATNAGLTFAPLGGDVNALLQKATNQGALSFRGNPFQTLAASLRYLRDAQPLFAQMVHDAWHHCRHARALVVTLPTLWGLQIAEALGIPCACALLQPLTPTRDFASPFLPTHSLGPALNRLTHHLLLRLLWLPWRCALRHWRQSTLGLRSPLPAEAFAASAALRVPWLYGISERIVPRPADWPPNHTLTGYWFLDMPQSWQPPPDLAQFLEAGTPPVFVGFGSMGAPQKHELDAVLAAMAALGQRVLLALDDAPPHSLPPWALAVEPTPHDWLFPRVAAVVHHGGAGTTAAALRAGVPQVILPVAVDQHFWGGRVAALGLGPPPVSRRRLSGEHLARALAQTLVPQVQARAAVLGKHIQAEQGVEQAVEHILRLL